MALTGRPALLAALGAIVVATVAPSIWGVVAVSTLLAVAVGVDVWLAGSPRSVRLARDGVARVRLGESAVVHLALTNMGTRTVRGLLRDAWSPSAGAAPSRFSIHVPPGERRVLETTLTPTRRGDRAASAVTIRSVGPLGLAARQRTERAPWTVRALPPFASRRHLPSRLARLRDLDGRQALLVRAAGTEFDSLRGYVAGDDVRSIDWRATARGGGVVVRTWRPERDRHVLLVLDVGRIAATRVGNAPRLDASLDAALLLGALAVRAGDRVDLLALDRTVRADVRQATPSELLPAFVNAMAGLEPALVETDYRRLVAEATARAGRSSLIVLLTGLEAAPVTEGLLPVLGPLLRRHTVLVAAVADPSVALQAKAREDSAAVYGAAAAEQALAERAQVAALLRRHGVHVVDAPPEHLPPALADAYLDLKAAGLL
jgi:uncharacterized protein (DUF58 family)